jgi:hypothetical protein
LDGGPATKVEGWPFRAEQTFNSRTQGSVPMVTNDALREPGIKRRINRDKSPPVLVILFLLMVAGFLIWVLATA